MHVGFIVLRFCALCMLRFASRDGNMLHAARLTRCVARFRSPFLLWILWILLVCLHALVCAIGVHVRVCVCVCSDMGHVAAGCRADYRRCARPRSRCRPGPEGGDGARTQVRGGVVVGAFARARCNIQGWHVCLQLYCIYSGTARVLTVRLSHCIYSGTVRVLTAR